MPSQLCRLLVVGFCASVALSSSTTGLARPVSSEESARQTLANTSIAFNQVATKVIPAVVAITAIKAEPPGGGLHAAGAIPGPQDGEDLNPDGQPSLGIGSGVVIRSDGIIVTNNHVVSNSERLTISFDEKKQYKAHVIGSDKKTDIAVLQIDEKVSGLPTVPFGNSDQVKVGDWALAIGNPFGLSHTVTSGIISAKGRTQMGVLDIEDFIQTDAAINPGNSGGPLLNISGEMIGLNAAIYSQTGGFMGIGFSIPSNLVKKISDDIIEHGQVHRGWLGLLTQDLTPDLSRYFKAPRETGALVSLVSGNGPADKGHIEVGDVITEYNHHAITDSSQLKSLVSTTKAGTRVPVVVIRKGETRELLFTIEEQPSENVRQQAGRVPPHDHHPNLGLTLENIPEEFRSLGLVPSEGALVVAVKPGSPAFDSGLMPGDIIIKANNEVIRTSEEFVAFGKKIKLSDVNVLYIQRLDKKLFIPLKEEA